MNKMVKIIAIVMITIMSLTSINVVATNNITSKSETRIAVETTKAASKVKTPTVKFSQRYIVVYNGKTRELKATASNKGKVTYTSSDTSVATVTQSGKITGKGKGVAYITATLASNKKVTARCYIYVMNKYNSRTPQDGDEKFVNGNVYSFDSFNKMSGASKDGWTKLELFGKSSFCTYCDKYIATKNNGKPCKGFCDGVHDSDEGMDKWICPKCDKKFGKCKCKANAYM